MDDNQQTDICRVCRSEGSAEKPLFYPCICTGSIKYIHQECLLQWLKYSRKEYCELCSHRFSFMPIYSPDMPKRLPIRDIFVGLLTSIGTAIGYWLHYTLVAVAWLGIVPLSACRIYRCFFAGTVNSVLSLPFDLLSTENLVSDIFQGCFVVTCTLCAFISLVWLREQILHDGGPEWLDAPAPDPPPQNNQDIANDVGRDAPANHNQAHNEVVVAENNMAEQNNGAQDDNNWNPIEWDRAAEELTWERLLGLDGSLVFLEHVFWVVSLNTLFILVFAFCPYHVGHFFVVGFKLNEYVSASHFDGLLTTLFGYVIIGLCLLILHGFVSLIRLQKTKRILGVCYIVVKVSLLSMMEIGLFPLVCGWWLDVCSLAMFDVNLEERHANFRKAPGTSTFLHWLAGMVYVFYFASFMLLLREVLRPGVLWFMRDFNDPDFNPIQEMIHLRLTRHIQRFLSSVVVFGTTVMIMLYVPVRLVRYLWPSFLPYHVVLSSNDSPVNELSLELLLLQVILPALLEQGNTRTWIKAVIRLWCVVISWVLDCRSYLLGDVPLPTNAENSDLDIVEDSDMADTEEEEYTDASDSEQEEVNEPVAQAEPADRPRFPLINFNNHQHNDHEQAPPGPQPEEEPPAAAAVPAAPLQGIGFNIGALGAAHQAFLQGGLAPQRFRHYIRPKFFYFKIAIVLVSVCVSLLIASTIMLTLPVYVGRKLMAVWLGDMKIHELYTAACGLYACWLAVCVVLLLFRWIPQGWSVIMGTVKFWAIVIIKTLMVSILLIGVIPLLLGLFFELVLVLPLRVPHNQTPLIFLWQVWALGILHAKIICAATMMFPDNFLRRAMQTIYANGIRDMNLKFVVLDFAMPIIVSLGLILAVPYVFAMRFVPLFGYDERSTNTLLRHFYPTAMGVSLAVSVFLFQMQQFKRLYEHIKNDKYLVGRRLVNYEHHRPYGHQHRPEAGNPPVAPVH